MRRKCGGGVIADTINKLFSFSWTCMVFQRSSCDDESCMSVLHRKQVMILDVQRHGVSQRQPTVEKVL